MTLSKKQRRASRKLMQNRNAWRSIRFKDLTRPALAYVPGTGIISTLASLFARSTHRSAR